MRKLIVFISLVLLLFSCRDSEKHEEVYLDFCMRYIRDIDKIAANVKTVVGKTGNRPGDLEVVNKSQSLLSLRNTYLHGFDIKNLLIYADTLSSRYAKLSNYNKTSLNKLMSFRKMTDRDSVETMSFFLSALKVEEELQEDLASKVGYEEIFCFKTLIPATSNSSYSLGDTAYIILDVPSLDLPEGNLHYDSVKIVNEQSSNPYNVINSGGNVILKTVVTRKGAYKIEGPVVFEIKHANFKSNFYIRNEFIVE